tara:strand:+ start:121 stop:783 length:663 start_codon:yes stop_codon:yes gene_type:complete
MGVVILTADEREYRINPYIEARTIRDAPTASDTSYIYHVGKLTEKEILRWVDVVTYRLVFVIDKLPKLSNETKEKVIIDKSLLRPKADFKKQFEGLFRWTDRQRVFSMFDGTPIPLALAFLRANRIDNMKLWRLIADTNFVLPEEYSKALLCFGVEPKRDYVQWPKKSKQVEEIPDGFRSSDIYWEHLIKCSANVRNDVRDTGKVPKGVAKTKERIVEWL